MDIKITADEYALLVDSVKNRVFNMQWELRRQDVTIKNLQTDNHRNLPRVIAKREEYSKRVDKMIALERSLESKGK